MRTISKERLIVINVLIAFEDGTASFRTPGGATLAGISENLDEIAKWHRGRPLYIDVRLAGANDRSRGRDRAHDARKVLEAGALDAAVFGRLFLANPDLPRRIELSAPLNAPDPTTFYTPGPRGLTDYQSLAS